jgi:hypothetical protein
MLKEVMPRAAEMDKTLTVDNIVSFLPRAFGPIAPDGVKKIYAAFGKKAPRATVAPKKTAG